MDDFKRDDPNVITPLPGVERRVQETVIIQRESSNAAWWGVGILAALAVVTLLWFLTRPAEQATDADLRVAQAEAAAESARQTAEAALVQNQLNGARDSVAIAQAQTATARAEAIRAEAEARTAQARASEPVIIERQTVVQPASNGPAVVTSTTPQP